MTDAIARLMNVSKTYNGTQALKEVSLDIRRGECLVLSGHNGSGKSTLIKTLLGFVQPEAGDVEILGRGPNQPGNAREKGLIGYLPENVAFDPGMTGRQVIRFYARLKGLSAEAGEPLLKRVGLSSRDAGRRVRQYSKGMRQRLGIAQTLLGEVRLLLLDEPTTGLDPEARLEFYNLVAELKASGIAVLISSHALSELEHQADRVAVMARGKLLKVGSLPEIRAAADLPVRIRLKTRPGCQDRIRALLPNGATVTSPAEEHLEIICAGAHKLEILRDILGQTDGICDLETFPPTLGELYAHMAQENNP
ncbi:ABC transporter ATP-binding protein [Luteithermobacter gelatinilyticus]|uniref:ABC transporter ATP-binding protein n=1 Tax=Luteithermobacter gelatinilyticus TaxID=2582913 RepID=UPI00110740C6|nr:ABC transporter ATP-binding protein [Luteithermobacter gelatinilyticus]